MIGDRRVDMDRVELGVGEHLFIARVASGDAELVAAGIELRSAAPTDRMHQRVRMALIDRDELRSETKPYDTHSDLLRCHVHSSRRANRFHASGVSPAL